MMVDRTNEGEDVQSIHKLGRTAPGILPSSRPSLPLEAQRRIEEALLPKIGAWDRSDVPLYKVTGSSIKEGRMIKLTKEANQKQVRLSGQLVLYIPFGSSPEGQKYIGTSASVTIFEANVRVQAT